MGRIFCLMGKSASGKDTIYKELLKIERLKLKKIVPYTTRPIRANEKDGVQYNFTDEQTLQRLQQENKVIECRSYDTVHGVWYYFTVDDNQVALDKYDYLIIGTPESYVSTREYYGKEVVVPIYIELDDGVRLERALNRERKQSNPKYEEMCRRFLADAKDFSEKNLSNAEIVNRFYNDDLDSCIGKIVQFIEKA